MASEQLEKALSAGRAVMANVSEDQLDDPTPCASWDVRALLNHMISAPRWGAATLQGEVVVREPHDFTSGDFLAEYDKSGRQATAALEIPGVLERTIQLPFGEVKGSLLQMMIVNDQFAHAWDLARATGQPTDLDPALASSVLAMVRGSIPDTFRGEDGKSLFGPEQVAPAGASVADQLAAFLGRRV